MFKIIMMHMDVHMHVHMHVHMGVHMNVVNHSCTVVRRGTVFRPSQYPSNITICICTCTWMWLIKKKHNHMHMHVHVDVVNHNHNHMHIQWQLVRWCVLVELSRREFNSCHADNFLKVFKFISIINRTKTSIRDGLEFKQHCGGSHIYIYIYI